MPQLGLENVSERIIRAGENIIRPSAAATTSKGEGICGKTNAISQSMTKANIHSSYFLPAFLLFIIWQNSL